MKTPINQLAAFGIIMVFTPITGIAANLDKQEQSTTNSQEKKPKNDTNHRTLTKTVANENSDYRHDGFFLRINVIGLGYATAWAKSGDEEISISGLAGVGEFSVGYSLSENLALHFSVNGPLMMGPEVSSGGDTSTTMNSFVSSIGFGFGITHYFMPSNSYFTVILGTSAMESYGQDDEISTKQGLSMHVSIGKEWWVSPKGGVGIAGALIYQRMKDHRGVDAPIWNNVAVGILMSATMN